MSLLCLGLSVDPHGLIRPCLDLTLARSMGDRLGEAKASGNLGNTLKVMGKFDEAVICCRRHLEICQEHRDRVGEGRALYNLGNVYHAKVRTSISFSSHSECV